MTTTSAMDAPRYVDTNPYRIGKYRFGRDPTHPWLWVLFDGNNELRGSYDKGWKARQHALLLDQHGDARPNARE